MRYTPLAGLLLLCHHVGTVQVTIERSSRQLLVDGQRFFARGVAYTPIPVGSDYGDYLGASQAAIWTQDLELMKAMNLNAIRAYTFDSVEDHTAFLDACDERGLLVAVTLDYPEDIYSDSTARTEWKTRALDVVNRYKSHPAILLWGFGNEKNFYADTEQKRTDHWSYVSEVTDEIHQAEQAAGVWHPVCSPLMDNYLSDYFALEASYPNAVDLWCLNLYRGSSFGTELFSTYPSTLPLMITEFGADAYDQTNGQEWATDEQGNALVSLSTELRDWRAVVAGGIVFAFQDEWWKCGAVSDHDVCGGYFGGLPDGFANEEWWGVYATGAGSNPQARPAVAQLTALFGADVFEGSSSIGAEADLYALKSNPGHNVGAVDEIVTKYHSWDAGSGPDGQSVYNEVGLVRFPALTLSECSNGTATVLLTVKWISSSSLVLAYGPVADQSWPELSTTWDNFPSFDPYDRRTLTVTSDELNQAVSLSVDWWSSGTALSMWLQPDDTVAANSDENLNFFSREASSWAQPQLVVSCSYSWSASNWYIATTTTTTSAITTTTTTTTTTTSSTTTSSTSTTSSTTTAEPSTTTEPPTTTDAQAATTTATTSTDAPTTTTASDATDTTTTTTRTSTTSNEPTTDTTTTSLTTTTGTRTSTTSTTTIDSTSTTATTTVVSSTKSSSTTASVTASVTASTTSTPMEVDSAVGDVTTSSTTASTTSMSSTTTLAMLTASLTTARAADATVVTTATTSRSQSISTVGATSMTSTSAFTLGRDPTTSSDPFSSTSFHDGTELQPTTSALGEELPSTASETTSTAGTRDSSTSTLGISTIQASCKLTISNLRADQSPSDLHLHVTVALAAALELEVKRLRNVVIELLPRRLVEETEVTAIEAALGVSYEVEASSDSVKELLSKVTSLADSQSDAAGRFTRSLKQEGLEVTHIQMLDVPHVYTTVQLPEEVPAEGLQTAQIVLWFLLGVTSSAVAGCVACSLGYFFGVFQVKLQRYRYERSRSLVSSQPSDFPVSVVTAQSTIKKYRSEEDASHDVPSKTPRAATRHPTTKSIIREVLL